MISVSNISFAFENCKVLKDVSFSCESGRIVGLVGINGAGKSTLLRLMSGVYEIEGGSIEYDGRKPSEEKLKGQLFFLPDDPYYTTHATAKSIFDMYKVFYPNLIYDEFYSAMSTLNLDMTKGVRSFSKGMRRQLYVALAFAIKPKYLLMENVKNLVGKKHKPNFDKWLDWLEEQGYTNYWQVLNAKDYGIPQNRERVFCISILGEHEPYIFPEKRELTLRLKDVLEDEVDEKFYLSEERVAQLTWK